MCTLKKILGRHLTYFRVFVDRCVYIRPSTLHPFSADILEQKQRSRPHSGRNADSSTTVHNPKTPLRGKKPFQRHPLAVRTGQVSQQVPRDRRQHALTIPCVGLCVLRSALLSEEGVHAHMDWHAHSNPLPRQCCPNDAQERSGSCRCLLPQSKNWRPPWRSSFFPILGTL